MIQHLRLLLGYVATKNEEARCMERYRRRPQEVRALKTYEGMPLDDIKRFLEGSGFDVHNHDEGARLKGSLEGDLKVAAGDYIVLHDDGKVTSCSAVEFEKDYESALNMDELHYVITRYGYSVKGAEYLLRDERARAIVLAPFLEQKKERLRRKSACKSVNSNEATEIVSTKLAHAIAYRLQNTNCLSE